MFDMVKILDARWETDGEKLQRINYYSSTKKKSENSMQWCHQHLDMLLSAHNEFSIQYPKSLFEAHVDKQEAYIEKLRVHNIYYNNVKNGHPMNCVCGKPMRYVNGWDFVGCSDYLNKTVKHDNFSYREEPELDLDQPVVGVNYLNNFKKHYEIPDWVMVSIIYKFLKTMGVVFLNDKINESQFTKGRDASLQSKIEEACLLPIVRKKWTSVKYQGAMRITYDNLSWKTIIPDYISVSEDHIFVLDAKKSLSNINLTQLDLYMEAVEIVAKKSGITSPVDGYFVLFNPEGTTPEIRKEYKCLTTSELLAL